MIFLIGWETFCNGLKIYFQKHKWGNTTLPDFIGAIQDAVNASSAEKKHDLHDWSKDWIQTKGSNMIVANFTEKDGKIADYAIKQTPCKYAEAINRFQSFNIALYDKAGKLLEKIENVTLEKKEETLIAAMNGKQVPDAFLLNSDDWGFGHFILDEKSIKVFE